MEQQWPCPLLWSPLGVKRTSEFASSCPLLTHNVDSRMPNEVLRKSFAQPIKVTPRRAQDFAFARILLNAISEAIMRRPAFITPNGRKTCAK
jgi:hypothetical protein